MIEVHVYDEHYVAIRAETANYRVMTFLQSCGHLCRGRNRGGESVRCHACLPQPGDETCEICRLSQ